MRKEGWDREGQISGKQRHKEICGRERDGAGKTGIQDGYYRDFQEGKQGIWRRWINGGRKDRGFGWGMIRGGGEQLL